MSWQTIECGKESVYTPSLQAVFSLHFLGVGYVGRLGLLEI